MKLECLLSLQKHAVDAKVCIFNLAHIPKLDVTDLIAVYRYGPVDRVAEPASTHSWDANGGWQPKTVDRPSEELQWFLQWLQWLGRHPVRACGVGLC